MKVCLFRPNIPGNFGNIIRTISCFGINEIDIILPTSFILNQKEVKRSMMDYGNDFNINTFESFEIYQKENIDKKIVLLTTKSEKSYTEYNFLDNEILLFGSESSGVTDLVFQNCDEKLTIKMANRKRSLNLAISVGIIVSYAKKNNF